MIIFQFFFKFCFFCKEKLCSREYSQVRRLRFLGCFIIEFNFRKFDAVFELLTCRCTAGIEVTSDICMLKADLLKHGFDWLNPPLLSILCLFSVSPERFCRFKKIQLNRFMFCRLKIQNNQPIFATSKFV